MGDLKVCLITPEFLPVWGGTGSYCVELADALSDKIELHIATVNRSLTKLNRLDQKSYRYKGKVQIHNLTESSSKDTFLFNGKMQLAVLRKLPSLLKEYHFDVLHSNFPAMPDLLFRGLPVNGYKTLTTVHTIIEMHRAGTHRSQNFSRKTENSEKMTKFLLPYILRSQKFYLSKERNFIFVSEYVRSLLHERYKNFEEKSREWVINNGVDTEEFSPKKANLFKEFFPNLGEEQAIVLFSGRLIGLKGISVLTRAMKTVISQNKDAHFVFAGPGSRELLNENLAKNDIPSNRVSVLGAVDRSKMPYLYAASNLLVLPSFVESLPLCALEAMSCGTPVIASNVGGLPEIIDDGQDGLLFKVGQADALSVKILNVLNDQNLAQSLAVNGRKKVLKKFSVSRMAKDTMTVYKTLS